MTSKQGAPSLVERRKAETQLDIARAAAELFAANGPDGTTAEAIAQRAGVALRTFYRYFRNKEEAVHPLLAHGGTAWRTLLAQTPAGTELGTALADAARRSLAAEADPDEALATTRGLLRAAATDPALRAVWYRVNQESEEQLVPVLAALLGGSPDPVELRLVAAAATDAIRIALETWSESDAGPAARPGTRSDEGPADGAEPPGQLVVHCMERLTAGLPLARRRTLG